LSADSYFKTLQQELPFAHPLPHYPVSKAPSLAPTFADKKEVGHIHAMLLMSMAFQLLKLKYPVHVQAPPPHIPAFLPAFPDKHT